MATLNAMPMMPRITKAKPVHACACGCGQPTKGTWHPGHDGRANGWAIRVMREIMTIDEVPANELAGCKIMIARAVKAEAIKASKEKVS